MFVQVSLYSKVYKTMYRSHMYTLFDTHVQSWHTSSDGQRCLEIVKFLCYDIQNVEILIFDNINELDVSRVFTWNFSRLKSAMTIWQKMGKFSKYFEFFKGKKRIFPKLLRMMPEA